MGSRNPHLSAIDDPVDLMVLPFDYAAGSYRKRVGSSVEGEAKALRSGLALMHKSPDIRART
jgi:hypothetical protein